MLNYKIKRTDKGFRCVVYDDLVRIYTSSLRDTHVEALCDGFEFLECFKHELTDIIERSNAPSPVICIRTRKTL